MHLVKYLRDEDNNPVGCIITIEKNIVGWSLCAKADKFSKKLAKNIAYSRASSALKDEVFPTADFWRDQILSNKALYFGKNENPFIRKLVTELYNQKERALKYFQDKA